MRIGGEPHTGYRAVTLGRAGPDIPPMLCESLPPLGTTAVARVCPLLHALLRSSAPQHACSESAYAESASPVQSLSHTFTSRAPRGQDAQFNESALRIRPDTGLSNE
jgi:hypothetical protein